MVKVRINEIASSENHRDMHVTDFLEASLEMFPRDIADEIRSLASNIKTFGLIHPITVRVDGDGYRLIAGHRRFKAVQYLGEAFPSWPMIEAIVQEGDGENDLSIALSENVFRSDLPSTDIARALDTIKRKKHFSSQKDLARYLGKSKTWVSQHLALLSADQSVVEGIDSGEITFAGARQIMTLPKEEQSEAIASAKEASGGDKATTRAIKSTVRRKKAEKKKQQEVIRPIAEREVEQKRECLDAFIADYWPEGKVPEDAEAIASLFWDHLMGQDRLVIRP